MLSYSNIFQPYMMTVMYNNQFQVWENNMINASGLVIDEFDHPYSLTVEEALALCNPNAIDSLTDGSTEFGWEIKTTPWREKYLTVLEEIQQERDEEEQVELDNKKAKMRAAAVRREEIRLEAIRVNEYIDSVVKPLISKLDRLIAFKQAFGNDVERKMMISFGYTRLVDVTTEAGSRLRRDRNMTNALRFVELLTELHSVYFKNEEPDMNKVFKRSEPELTYNVLTKLVPLLEKLGGFDVDEIPEAGVVFNRFQSRVIVDYSPEKSKVIFTDYEWLSDELSRHDGKSLTTRQAGDSRKYRVSVKPMHDSVSFKLIPLF